MNQIAQKETQLATIEPDNSNTILSMIERAARDPSVDIDKLERLMQMSERAEAKRADTAFNDALNQAQGEIGTIGTNKTNSQTHSSYATYEKLDVKLRPIYIRHGFALSFDTAEGAPENCIRVVCYVSHKGGHTRRYQADMPADGKGAKGNDVMTKTHAAGSAMSYGQRYLLKMIFNVAVGEHDDDGNAASAVGDFTLADAPEFADWRSAIEACETKTALADLWTTMPKDAQKALARVKDAQKSRVAP